MRFEWDPTKAESNIAKHGITFEEAATVFDDPYARVIDDPDHSLEEERFIILGMSMRARELVVSHCLRGSGARQFASYRQERRPRGSPHSIGGT